MAKKKKKQTHKSASQLANKQPQQQRNMQQTSKPNKYQKKQEKYLSKKRQQRERELPKKLSKLELEQYKYDLKDLFDEANYRIRMIQHAGYISYALDRVIKEGGSDYFDISEVNTREQLIREMTRARIFINDVGSTIEGARIETAQIYASEYKGKFGNEYNNKENQYARYDVKAIDKDVASRAFESYRKIEEHRAGEIVKEGAYGSENLIIALYDAEIRGMDSLSYGEALLDAFVDTSNEEWNHAREQSNMISGITGVIEDKLLYGDNITRGRLF